MEGMEEIVQEFLIESHENLDQLDQDLLALERDPESRDLLSSIFRTLHTIKGTSGFLALNTLERVAHAGESLLSKLRDGELVLNPQMTTVLLEMVDAIRVLLGNIEEQGQEGAETYEPLVSRLHAMLEGRPIEADAASDASAQAGQPGEAEAAEATVVETTVVEPTVVEAPVTQEVQPETVTQIVQVEQTEQVLTVTTTNQTVVAQVDGSPVAEAQTAVAVLSAAREQSQADAAPAAALPTTVVPSEPAAAAQAAAAAQTTAVQAGAKTAAETPASAVGGNAGGNGGGKEGGEPRRSVADSSIRVDVDLLDSLMNLVGELVLTRNQLLQRAAARQDQELMRSMHRLNLVAGELQEGVMKTRMQPIDNVWSKIPRVVRDLANTMGKQIRVVMEGKETELDKTILEAIKDPLTHLVRNSCDHGIETPAERLAKGKPEQGTLLLRAFHEGGQVNIEIIDDGAGIDPDKLREKAVERQLMSREEAERLSDRDATHLIFRAGFSTAKAVTNVSGRGVGMDVVKTNIEKIGGVIDITSAVGEGSTVRIKIPLTLAIIPALLVRGQDNMFAIPQVNLLELVRLDREQAAERLENIQGTPVYRLRGALLPLVDLREQLGVEKVDHETTFIAVLRADQRQFGLVVDDIEDTEEIVVKPLGKQLRGINMYAGATLMGDGRVALILDANSLAARAGMINDSGEAAKRAAEEAARKSNSDSTSLLVVQLSNGRRAALPLNVVERLEEFPMSRVETVGSNQVVQYRGVILPLLRLADDYGGYAEEQTSALQVVVCQHRGQLFGFVVASVLDIVEDELAIRTHLDTGGNLGSAVVNEHVTELLNIDQALQGMLPPELESFGGGDYSGAYAGPEA